MPTFETKLSADHALRCARVFSELLACYDLHPNERRLACAILAATFCAGVAGAALDLDRVSREIGVREMRCYAALESLISLRLVFWDSATGVVTPNPDPESLSRERALRARPSKGGPEKELPLDGERLLEAALASNSRSAANNPPENSGTAVAGTSFDVHRHCEEFRNALMSGVGLDRFAEPVPIPKPPPVTVKPAVGGDPPPPGASLSFSSAKLCTKELSLAEGAAAGGRQRETVDPDEVWSRIVPLLSEQRLTDHQRQEWQRLWQSDPAYVDRLWFRLRSRLGAPDLPKLNSKLGWMARVARDEGKLR